MRRALGILNFERSQNWITLVFPMGADTDDNCYSDNNSHMNTYRSEIYIYEYSYIYMCMYATPQEPTFACKTH